MNIREFKKKLHCIEGFNQLEKIFNVFLAQYNITHYAFTYYSRHPNTENKIKYSYASRSYRVWHEHFLAQQYEDVDSTMTIVHRGTLPVQWNLQQQLAEAKSERERQMRLDSIKFGSEKGISIPIHGPFEDFAVLVLVQMRGENFLNQWENIQHEIMTAAHFFYNEANRLLLKTHSKKSAYNLSPQQIQCLQLTATRHNAAEIAKELGITERTVNFHLQKANKKLGTKNKHQSVAKAIEKGILKL